MKLSCYTYQLPFKRPLVTSSRVYHHRQGLLLAVREAGQWHYGEVAPLPGFSAESLEDVTGQLQRHLSDFQTILKSGSPAAQLQDFFKHNEVPPSLQFGLESLALQLEAQQAAQPLSTYLFTDFSSRLRVNGLVSLVDQDELLPAIRQLREEGFETIKCKVGSDFKREQQALADIRTHFPNLRIRLDCNRSWTLEQAIKNLSALDSLNIEYCEEPLAQPRPSAYCRLSGYTEIPLALDETLNKHQNWQEILPSIAVLIIKPMMIGSFETIRAIALQARQAGLSIVVTTSLESSVGRSLVALVAAGLGSPDLAHGLNTGTLLGRDLEPNPTRIKEGHLNFPTPFHFQELKPNHLTKIASVS